jgi:N-acetylglutamate synthase-like GNAT family acetyltransferase
MIEIKEYKDKYAKDISAIVLEDLYKINIKDQGKNVIDKLAPEFSQESIRINFPKRSKCYVALEGNNIIGTASIDKFRGDDTGKKYIILTVFVKMGYQNMGIGKLLFQELDKYIKSNKIEEVLIPASVYGLEFYRKMGYDYVDGIKKQNQDKEYILVKHFYY